MKRAPTCATYFRTDMVMSPHLQTCDSSTREPCVWERSHKVWFGRTLAESPRNSPQPLNWAQAWPVFRHDTVLCCWVEPHFLSYPPVPWMETRHSPWRVSGFLLPYAFFSCMYYVILGSSVTLIRSSVWAALLSLDHIIQLCSLGVLFSSSGTLPSSMITCIWSTRP